ncbi:MAG TPA: aromatic acid exporter family protein [Pseudonocardia sp.]|nr:aromatic acid exporter family protein [Pseudonocardia sp.]
MPKAGWQVVPRVLRRALDRVRTRGRSALLRAARLTGAAVVAYVVAEAVGLRSPPPLVAALTALLVVQATLASTLVNGVQRVFSVAAGVALAVLFVAVVGLTWWSLAALVGASIVVGQLLRLGPHLVEVPISAMLVLGVGYSTGAEALGAGRLLETVVGAVVGVLVNLLFPPAVQTRYAGQAVERFAEEIAALLDETAAVISAGEVDPGQTQRLLDDARRLNRHAPRVDRALAHAMESRRFNVRALATPRAERGLREGVDALEHSSVSTRTLLRAVHDATHEQRGVREDPGYVQEVRRVTGDVLTGMARVVRAYGRLVSAEISTPAEEEQRELTDALGELRRTRSRSEALLLDDPRSRGGLWELNAALLTAADRMLLELDVGHHAQVRQSGPRAGAAPLGRLRPRMRHRTPGAGRAAPEPPPDG